MFRKLRVKSAMDIATLGTEENENVDLTQVTCMPDQDRSKHPTPRGSPDSIHSPRAVKNMSPVKSSRTATMLNIIEKSFSSPSMFPISSGDPVTFLFSKEKLPKDDYKRTEEEATVDTAVGLLFMACFHRQPKISTVHCSLGPTTLVTNSINALQTCPQDPAHIMQGFFPRMQVCEELCRYFNGSCIESVDCFFLMLTDGLLYIAFIMFSDTSPGNCPFPLNFQIFWTSFQTYALSAFWLVWIKVWYDAKCVVDVRESSMVLRRRMKSNLLDIRIAMQDYFLAPFDWKIFLQPLILSD
ncbi:hypothetical protein H671_6g15504 [Cricetulus griseus]|uniref:Uncharacterized protein n=1 Tax=Cricetulus griseus TaxID=10029 RepID=A0A061I4J3_CRIGR|nr:hypothetical protein H671_6g15504 [Cricetulus griseus]